MLAFAILSPLIGTLIALGSIALFPVVLAIRAVQLILKPVVILIEMMLLKTEKIFIRAYDAVFHRHGAIAH